MDHRCLRLGHRATDVVSGSSTASKVSKDQRHRHGAGERCMKPWQRRQRTAHESTTRCSLHRRVPGPGLVVQASGPHREREAERQLHGRGGSSPPSDAGGRRALALAVVARRAPPAGHSSKPSSGCWPSSRSSCPWPSTLPPRHPRAPARPLDLHAVVTMLGAWAAWMAAVAPSSADATPPANLSRSMLVASPSGYPAGWPSR
jgi:hypothetical protein